MSVKQVKIVVPGSGISAHLAVTPGLTAADALRRVGLETGVDLDGGYVLSGDGGNGYFHPDDVLDPHVRQGAVLYANPWAAVGSGGCLAANLAGVAIGILVLCVLVVCLSGLMSQKRVPRRARIGAGARASSKTSAIPLWQHLGWERSDDSYSGFYNVDGQWLQGGIFFRSSWDYDFRVLAPKKLIAACGEHSRCFVPRSRTRADGRRWFSAHFQRRPDSVSSGILAVQNMLCWGARRLLEGIA